MMGPNPIRQPRKADQTKSGKKLKARLCRQRHFQLSDRTENLVEATDAVIGDSVFVDACFRCVPLPDGIITNGFAVQIADHFFRDFNLQTFGLAAS